MVTFIMEKTSQGHFLKKEMLELERFKLTQPGFDKALHPLKVPKNSGCESLQFQRCCSSHYNQGPVH